MLLVSQFNRLSLTIFFSYNSTENKSQKTDLQKQHRIMDMTLWFVQVRVLAVKSATCFKTLCFLLTCIYWFLYCNSNNSIRIKIIAQYTF